MEDSGERARLEYRRRRRPGIVSAQLSAPRVASTTDPPLPAFLGGGSLIFVHLGEYYALPGPLVPPPFPPGRLFTTDPLPLPQVAYSGGVA